MLWILSKFRHHFDKFTLTDILVDYKETNMYLSYCFMIMSLSTGARLSEVLKMTDRILTEGVVIQDKTKRFKGKAGRKLDSERGMP